jgi:hypothetical protein
VTRNSLAYHVVNDMVKETPGQRLSLWVFSLYRRDFESSRDRMVPPTQAVLTYTPAVMSEGKVLRRAQLLIKDAQTGKEIAYLGYANGAELNFYTSYQECAEEFNTKIDAYKQRGDNLINAINTFQNKVERERRII